MPKEIVIELNHINVQHIDFPVLNDVSLSVEKGEFVYLVGQTGSGKSSLLKILYGEIPINGGTGTVAGFQLHELTEKQIPLLRRKTGIVFQDFQLLTDRDVQSNLHFVLQATGWKDKGERQTKIAETLQLVGLKDCENKMPHQLSGGEQQRVVIARALLNDPEIILADEPTGNLDPETSKEIVALLLDISKKKHTAVLMATHDYHMIDSFPSRVIKCDQNQIKEVAIK